MPPTVTGCKSLPRLLTALPPLQAPAPPRLATSPALPLTRTLSPTDTITNRHPPSPSVTSHAGSSSYLDVTSPAVRSWWVEQFGLDKYQGSTQHLYIWNDMNEPSVFNGPEITMPKDVLHWGDVEHR